MIKKIFEPCEIDYPDLGYDLPIRYTEDFLKDIASQTGSISLTNAHDEVIDEIKNFVYKEDGLYADIPDGLDITGLGFSPAFEMDIIDGDNCLFPHDAILKEVALTKNPRSEVIYNSKGDGRMNQDELLEKLTDATSEIAQQREALKKLEEENKSLKANSDESKATIEELNKKTDELKKLQAQADKLKESAEKYEEIEQKEREELINTLAGDDEESKQELADVPLKTLRFFKNKNRINTKPRGVGENGAIGLDSDGIQHIDNPDDNDDDPDEPPKIEDYEAWKKENNVW